MERSTGVGLGMPTLVAIDWTVERLSPEITLMSTLLSMKNLMMSLASLRSSSSSNAKPKRVSFSGVFLITEMMR